MARALLALAGVAAVLVFAEVVLRVTTPASDATLFLFTTDTPRYKVMRANLSGHVYGVPIRTNALGFRDDDGVVPPKRPGRKRIVVLGDSFTVSAGVPYSKIFTSRLEAALGVEVINLGCAGYNVIQYGHVLDEVGLGLEPEVVIVGLFVPNDFEMKSYAASREVALGLREAPRRPVWRGSRILSLIVSRGIGAYRGLRAGIGLGTGRPVDQLEGWEQNLSALARLREVGERDGFRLLIAVLPGNFDYDLQTAAHARVLRACHELGVRCVDLLESFRERGASPDDFALSLVDPHPNALYHEVVASRLATELEADLRD